MNDAPRLLIGTKDRARRRHWHIGRQTFKGKLIEGPREPEIYASDIGRRGANTAVRKIAQRMARDAGDDKPADAQRVGYGKWSVYYWTKRGYDADIGSIVRVRKILCHDTACLIDVVETE